VDLTPFFRSGRRGCRKRVADRGTPRPRPPAFGDGEAAPEKRRSARDELADLLNDIELLPEFVADDWDRTDEFIETLQGLAEVHPTCRYIVAEFEQASTQAK